jgi:hypothetical protein
MEWATHLRRDPNTRVSVADTGDVGVTIPTPERINSIPRRSHDLVIRQTLRQRIREARIEYPLVKR